MRRFICRSLECIFGHIPFLRLRRRDTVRYTAYSGIQQIQLDIARYIRIGLYRILLLPILYMVWHTKGGSGGVVFCAIVMQ